MLTVRDPHVLRVSFRFSERRYNEKYHNCDGAKRVEF